jgi:hypothetical protein
MQIENTREYNINGSGQTLKERRGESSKSRASMRSNIHGSVANEIGPISHISNAIAGLNLGKQQVIYASKYNLKDNNQ